ncbi:MAG: PaaI family thioesterase [Acidimicrobiia bacterium]
MISTAAVNALVAEQFPSAYSSGYRCLELGDLSALARWEHDPAVLRPGGYISGLTLFGLADIALWYATFTVVGLEPMAVTSDLAISFLRPAVGASVLGKAQVLRVGSTRIYGQIDMWLEGDESRLVAQAHGNYSPPAARRTSGSPPA